MLELAYVWCGFCGALPLRRNGTQHECRQSLNIREDASSTRGSLDLSKFQESSEWGLASRTLGEAYCEYALFPKIYVTNVELDGRVLYRYSSGWCWGYR
jgi:hypothetical protein